MNIILNFALFFILLVKNQSAFGLIPRIADGSNAAKKEFPFQVSFQKISRNNRHFCGGTIIHRQFILTAAHCVTGDSNDVRIVAGVVDLKKQLQPENIRRIAKVIKDPNYNRPLPKQNDIALVKVNSPFTFSQSIDKADLPSSTYHIPVGQKLHVSGWGLERASGTSPTDKLKKTKVKVLDYSQCVTKYRGVLTIENTVFCTVHDNLISNRGVCNGDSGGPVVINKKILVGVIKGGFHGSPVRNIVAQCGSNTYPDMHSEVSKYRTWIDTTITANL